MTHDRRSFLKLSAAAGGALVVNGAVARDAGALAAQAHAPRERDVPRAPVSLNILILGGTGFTGPEQVEYALARGHRITLFNRNRTRPDLFKGKVDQLIGDLAGDASALAGKKFDVVLDNPTTFPFWVRNAAQYLKGHVGHYIFISTISVYPDNSVPNADEDAPTTPMPVGVDPYTTVREHAGQYYGALKTFAEQEVARHYGMAHTMVRPGLIVGPLDRSDRFTYWPARIDRGGDVLAPGTPDDPAQYIDSRDLAEFMVRLAENRVFGTFNATGPARPTTMAETLYGIKAVTTAGASFTWVPADFLASQEIRGWRHMPIWLPPQGATAGFLRRSISRALAQGLTFRPLAVTAKDTLDWHQTRSEAERKAMADGAVAGISAQRESEVLTAWNARKQE